MLKLTIKPGEYLNIGEDIRIIFSGGTANNMHVLVDAPRKYNVVRSRVLEREGQNEQYYREAPISEAAVMKIRQILKEEKENSGRKPVRAAAGARQGVQNEMIRK